MQWYERSIALPAAAAAVASSSSSSSTSSLPASAGMEKVERLASENAVVVFSFSSCCMCHVVKRLFCSLGVNLTVYELDQEADGQDLKEALDVVMAGYSHFDSTPPLLPPPLPVPAVFIGGKLIGGLDRVMAAHINSSLVPLLRQAGALWL